MLLDELLYESSELELLRPYFRLLNELFAPGTLIIADLTDRMVRPYEATAAF